MKSKSSQKINILYVTTSATSHGGIEETLRILCANLDKNIFRIAVCSIQDKPEQILDEFKQLNIELFGLNRKAPLYDLITLWQVRDVISHFQAHIVHTHNDKGNWHGRMAALLSRQCAIITTHHDLGDRFYSKSSQLSTHSVDSMQSGRVNIGSTYIYPFFNVLFNRFNYKVICVSNAVKNIYTIENDPRFAVVYAPFDESIFKPTQRQRRKTIILGTVGRLVWQKGHLNLLKALTKVVTRFPNVLLKIKGQGQLEVPLNDFVAANNLQDYVEFCGDQRHDADLYHDLDIFIQPSVTEGCSITLLEALASKLPVIATNQDGPKELIKSGEHGLLVDVQNTDALSAAICDLIVDPEKAKYLAETGHARAMTEFSSGVFIHKISEIYQQAARSVV